MGQVLGESLDLLSTQLLNWEHLLLDLIIAQDRNALGIASASRAAECLRNAIAFQGYARLVVATGSSQFEVLETLVNDSTVDWSKVDGFHLDEYIGLDGNHPASFCGYLKKRFADRLPLRSFHYLNGSADPIDICNRATQAILVAPIDLALVGIGENGHLAFNDPPADFYTPDSYRIVQLDKACRMQQVGEGWFDDLSQVPEQAISMTVHQIMCAKKIICSVPDRRKAVAVAGTIQGPVTPDVPASILQNHINLTMVLDESSASLLDQQWFQAATRV